MDDGVTKLILEDALLPVGGPKFALVIASMQIDGMDSAQNPQVTRGILMRF
jgi:hypothetical protein